MCTLIGVLLLSPWRAAAAEPWWSYKALAGTAVTALQADGPDVVVRTASGRVLQSTDGGSTFATQPEATGLSPPPLVRSGNDRWRIDASGHVLHAHGRGPLTQDPKSPDLGAGAHLLAAPAAHPGVVVAVAQNGMVWRRGGDGDWALALVLLPASLISGVPRVTSLTAFAQPLTDTVYLATDGFSVLITTDGGDDWIRANPGLPDAVFALAADDRAHAVFAGTSNGLYVHHLQAFPAPPSYRDSALTLRWLGISLVTLLSALLAGLFLVRLVAQPRDLRA